MWALNTLSMQLVTIVQNEVTYIIVSVTLRTTSVGRVESISMNTGHGEVTVSIDTRYRKCAVLTPLVIYVVSGRT